MEDVIQIEKFKSLSKNEQIDLLNQLKIIMGNDEEKITITKSNVKRFYIYTEDGVNTGNYLEFDLDDIELPLKINKCDFEHRKNVEYVQGKFLIIDKQEDKKGKFFLTWKEEEKVKVVKEFYEREEKVIDMLIGEGGTRKLLNGRKPYYSMYDDIAEMLKPILPTLEKIVNSINDKIRNKYKEVQETDLTLE